MSNPAIFSGLPVLRGFSRNAKQDSEVSEANGGAERSSALLRHFVPRNDRLHDFSQRSLRRRLGSEQ
jgi:hypothetical protein